MLILAVTMLLSANPAEGPTDPKTAFKACISRLDIDDVISDGDGMTKCLREYGATMPKDDTQNVDPIAKQVADGEADKYTLLLTAKRYDPQALCVQAGLTARAYLDATMMTQYDRWKANERRSCREAATAGRRRD